MDKVSKEQRSENMRRIRSINTTPELQVRKALFSLGYRFRLHSTKLIGKPDIVLPKYKLAIFVHGCFWHRHENCKEASRPKTNSEFWEKKLLGNVQRDKNNAEKAKEAGWKVVVVWECELKKHIEENRMLIKKIIDNAL